jgi:glycosyltransferase involved in cell wall biosynthesis
MLRRVTPAPRRILMTLDAVGGVWRYALGLAAGLAERDCAVSFVGQGPQPSAAARAEVEAIPGARLFWLEEPLDWLADGPAALASLPHRLAALAAAQAADLVHLNLPSQAAGLVLDIPVVVVSHSCLSTWWEAVRGGPLPQAWAWQHALTGEGLSAADVAVAPSRPHADALERAYGPQPRLRVVTNGVPPAETTAPPRRNCVVAAARWWDDGKNGRVLDEAAASSPWPVVMAGALQGPRGERFDPVHAAAPGALPPARLRALMAEAGIVASPSLYEPFGLVVGEAAATGAPLVLSDIPTYRTLWGDAALFADPRDPTAFAEAVRRLAGDADLRRDLGDRARRRARRVALRAQVGTKVEVYAAAGSAARARARAAEPKARVAV